MDGLVDRALTDALKCYPGWRRIAENCFAIISSQDTKTLHAFLATHITDREYLYVFDIGTAWQGTGPPEVVDWLNWHVRAVSEPRRSSDLLQDAMASVTRR